MFNFCGTLNYIATLKDPFEFPSFSLLTRKELSQFCHGPQDRGKEQLWCRQERLIQTLKESLCPKQKLVGFIMLVSSQSQKEAARFDLAQALCKTPLPQNFDGHNTNTSLALKSVRSRVARQVGPTLQDARLAFSHICTRGKIEKARRTTFLRQSPGAIARLHPPNNLARLEYHFWGSLMLQWFPSFVLFFVSFMWPLILRMEKDPKAADMNPHLMMLTIYG